jgi:membrane glycosyltransferase
MDKLTELAQGGGGPATDEPAPGMPPESPVPMPEQSADSFDAATARAFIDPVRSRSPRWPRVFVLGGAFLLLAGAAYEMYRVLEVGGLTIVEAVVLVFFAVNFAWIALAFLGSIGGFALLVKRRFRPIALSHAPIAGRTAMLMPTFNENPERVFAAVEAMARATEAADPAAVIDWFILSDTTDPRIVLAEEAALMAIRARLGRTPRIYYRHRRLNIARKAGNIADFCRRWGGAYD